MKEKIFCLMWLIACTALLHAEHPTGLLKLPEEELRLVRASVSGYGSDVPRTRGENPLPASVQNLEHLPVVWSQGTMGICGSFAPSYYLFNYYISKRDGGGRYNPASDGARMCSPMWAVHVVHHAGSNQPNGANSLMAIQKLVSIGYLTWEEMPFDGAYAQYFFPSAEIQLKAMGRKGGGALRLSDIQTQEGLQKLKKALADGDIFVASTAPITKNFDNYPGTDGAEPDSVNGPGNVFAWPSSLKASDVREPHAVTIVGYDDTKTYVSKDGKACSGALLAVNSWGTGWGNGGFIWIAYDAVLTHHFLDGEIYSMRISDGNYIPQSTAVVTLEDDDGNWRETATGSGVFWPHFMKFSLNGYSLENPVSGSSYLCGMEENPLKTELLLDLTGHEDIRLQQLDISCSMAASTSLGILYKVEFLNAEGKSVHTKNIEEVIQGKTMFPIYRCVVSSLDQTKGKMPDIYPYRGSLQWDDLNGDGRLDLAIAGYQADNAGKEEEIKAVFLQNPDGSWTRKNLDALDLQYQCTLVLAELTGDRCPDLAVTNGMELLLLKNNGNGEFSKLASVDIDSGGNFHGPFLKTADFDNDGKLDFLVMDSKRIIIVRQTAATDYAVYPISNLSNPIWFDCVGDCLAVGDMNGDGWTDIVAEIETASQKKYVMLVNQGDFTFEPHLLPLPAYSFTSIAIADANGDGCDDILFSGGTCYSSIVAGTVEECKVLICHGRPDADGKVQLPQFAAIDSAFVPNWGGNVAWADLDMDGRLEAVITGTTNPVPARGGTSSPYEQSYVNSMAGQLHNASKTYLKILQWDGNAYVDSKLQLPGTVGQWGPSALSVCDFNKDGKPDIIHAGALGAKSLVGATPNHNAAAIIHLQNELDKSGLPPAVPEGLSARALGSGKVQFTWKDSSDDTTSAGGLRYVLRIGTSSGSDDVLNELECRPCRSGIILTHLPNKRLFWAVRAVDASGLCSEWSREFTVTSTGITPNPVIQTDFPVPAPLPKVNVTIVNAEPERGTVSGPTSATVGSTITLNARAASGYRFSHWEGDVRYPLNRNSEAVVLGETAYTAHFVPDYSTLQMDENCIGFLDSRKNFWYYTHPARKEVPQTSTYSGSSFFVLARGTAYFAKIGPRELPDWSWCTSFPYTADWAGTGRQQLLRAVDNNLWHQSLGANFGDENGYGGYPELTERAWGGPGGLAVVYQLWQTASYHKREVYLKPSGSAAGYSVSFAIEGTNADNDPIECVPQRDFFLMLTTSGKIKAKGNNSNGVFGVSTPVSSSEFMTVPGLPAIQAIAAGEGFAAAIDVNGKLWTWGSNSHGQLGRGSQGDVFPEPEKVTGLSSRIVAIAAGDNHLLALDETGRLHAWGDNSKGQLGADDGNPLAGSLCHRIAAAGNHSCAITSSGDLFYWGNGENQPVSIDNINFNPVVFTFDVEDRAAALLPQTAGTFICRAGRPFSLKAESAEKATFSHWLLNGEKRIDNPLTFTPEDTFTLKAIYSFPKALISFDSPEVGSFRTVVPVQISNTDNPYDGLSFSLQYSKNLQLLGMEFDYPVPNKQLRYRTGELSEPMQSAEFYIYGSLGNVDQNLFNRKPAEDGSPVLMLRLLFANSAEGDDATVSFNGIPKLSRSLGKYSDEAATGTPLSFSLTTRKDNMPRVARMNEVSDGKFCYLFIPGDPQISTIEELTKHLGAESVSVWTWDGSCFRTSSELKGQQPMLVTVKGGSNDGIPYVRAPQRQLTLSAGWNLVMVQQETPVPDNAAGVFRLDLSYKVYVKHGGMLCPGEIYWLYRN